MATKFNIMHFNKGDKDYMNHDESQLVHRYETVLFVICIIATVSIAFWLLLSIVGALIFLGLALLSLFSHGISMAHIRVNGVKLRENQFPELYEKVNTLADKMKIGHVPEVYIIESGGMLNAFATRVFGLFGKNIVVLYSDFVDLAEDFHEHEVEYVIAHELAHIKRNHIVKNLLIAPAMWVPFLGVSYSRMAEYTCDRMAAYYTGRPESATSGLLVLASGKRLFTKVHLQPYLEQYNETKGIMVTLMELLSTHPPIPKRIHEIETFFQNEPTVKLASRSKYIVIIAVFLGFVIPALFTAAIVAGVMAFDDFNFSEVSPSGETTPLMDAVYNGDVEEVENLLADGADPNEKGEYGESPLLVATYSLYPDIMDLLLTNGADPNISDEEGWTPLMSAVVTADMNVVQILLDAGADPTQQDSYGMNAIDHAKDMGYDDYIELLESYQ